ncbi:MAG: efflux RND transporter periplasmic adaptor subunit [Deltaproteobacteria bacterium]
MNRELLVTLTLSLAACGARSEPTATGTPPKAAPIRVETIVVEERPVPKTVLLAGSLKAFEESDLAANASGRVLRTMVERGSVVAKGAPIAQLDTRFSALAAAEAKANLEAAAEQKKLAQNDCQRFQRLYQKGTIAQQEFDRVMSACKTSAESADAAAARAQEALQMVGDATIRAPFAGLVAERYVSPGEYVRPDSRVVHLVDVDPLRLELTIPEADIAAVKEGQKVDFQVDAYPGQTFTGTVRYIGPAVRATTRDLVFEALVSNSDRRLLPGIFASAQLVIGTQSLPVVPLSVLRHDGETWRAFVVVDRQLEERVVQLGPALGALVAVPNGLSAGDRLVAHPTAKIADGLPVAE